MKYTKLFNQHSEYVAYTASTSFIRPNVSWCILEEEPHCTPADSPSHDYSLDYLTLDVLTGGTINWVTSNSTTKAISYSKDSGTTWTEITATTTGTPINVIAGDKVLVKGSNAQYGTSQNDYSAFSGGTATYNVYGNIMSLIYGDNFTGQTVLSQNWTLPNMFKGTNVVSAENLVLPATTLKYGCYYGMFSGCTSLTKAPSELPATAIEEQCYYNMFSDCTSLTTVPSDYLPAGTMKAHCYRAMFKNCTSLTNAPTLSATTLNQYCYCEMFNNCTSLVTVQSVLPSLTINADACEDMFKGCSGLASAPEIMATTINMKGCYHMFSGCTSLTSAPTIHASTVKQQGCAYMFSECTSLTTAQSTLSATTLESYCYTNMFRGCTLLTVAPTLPAATIPSYCYQQMFKSCISLATVQSVLPATTLASSCYSEMFRGCTSLTTAPELPAATLVDSCYYNMFRDCNSLNYIKCLATDITATTCTYYWVNNVASTGTFVKESAMSSWTTGHTGIPTNWNVIDDGIEPPTISCDGLEITITCATVGASIYYKLDHTGDFTLYESPITMTADTLVEAYSTFNGVTSTTVSETCIYTPHDYSQDYLTFRVTSGGTIRWMSNGSGYAKVIQYSINDGEWTSITAGSSSNITVATNDVVRFKGTNETYAGSKANYAGFDSGGTAVFDIEGNIMSLIYGDNFVGQTAMTGTYNFCSIFKLSKVVSAENLILPATTLTNYCYRAMFSLCPNLVTPPALPATTLAQGCYWYMFEKCPMTTAPELLATTLVKECYGNMFNNCANLNYIKCLATSGLNAASALTGWVTSVAFSGTFIKDSSTTTGSTAASTVWTKGNNGIPTNWLIQDDGTPDVPTISCNGLKIELSCATDGADIYYRLTNSGSYTQYTTAITMTGDTYIECYSEKDGMSSTTTSMTCEYDDRTIYEYANQSLDTWTRSGSAVTVPNSVNAIDGHSSSYAKGTFNYETTVNLRDTEPTYLWFQHADHKADIYVDDVLVDTHWGGYNAFFSDISNYAHEGTNHIKVALKNNNGDYLAPASGDFNFNATLGKVKLFTSPYMPAMNYGYDGFHITSTVSSAEATINVATSVPTGASVVCTISGVNCNYTATSASTGADMIFTTTITNPRLWNGTIDPYLYNVKLEIYHDNELYHKYERPYGLRFYEYVINDTEKYGTAGNPYTGFLLNGQPYLLRGCCMHDDIANKANALNDADYTQTFNIIQELGLNFLRLAHYPHPKEVYDWCDRLGIVVQTEGSCVNKLQSTMPTEYYERLNGQYTDMVNQHYNHPCIFFWGLSNETSTDDKAFGKQKVEEYTALIKNLDSERMVGYVLAQGNETSPSAYYNDPSNVDWFGCNIYVGWYDSPNSNNPTPQINTRLNNTIGRVSKPMAYSEYGCGGTQACHSDDFLNTTTRGNHERHDIEYQMWLHEGHIAAIKSFPQLLFTSQWQLFDIAVASRNEGYTECLDGINTSTNDALRRLNNKGLVERDHVTKKDTFYLYKAWWNTADTFVHICGKNYIKNVDRAIKCYTNDGNTLTMYVNGVSAATATVTNNIATFAARDFAKNDVVAICGNTATDSLTFTQVLTRVTGVSLNKNTLTLTEGGTETLIPTIIPANANDKRVTWATSNSSIATVSSGGVVTAVASGNCSITVTTNDGGYTAQCTVTVNDPYNGHAYVDLGLPSGTKWATMNIGASSETGYGNYYKYGSGATQYVGNDDYYSGTENPLALSGDTARQVWGGAWHMPTSAQYQELIDNTDYEWTTINGVNGTKFTSKTDSTKYVFFPAGGSYSALDYNLNGVGNIGIYFSSTPSSNLDAGVLYFHNYNNNYHITVSYNTRKGGNSVHGVVG